MSWFSIIVGFEVFILYFNLFLYRFTAGADFHPGRQLGNVHPRIYHVFFQDSSRGAAIFEQVIADRRVTGESDPMMVS